jgi:pimeloyl-ACP methyl ester carboxylesterase
MLRAYADGLFGEQHGTGVAGVLALPGWMRTRQDFAAVLEGLDAIALDLPGFGGTSPAPVEAMGAAGYADTAAPALDVCAPRPVLLGHSFGGRVAVHLAAREPGRFAGVVLAGVPLLHKEGRPSKPPLRFRAVRWLHRRGVVSDARMEALRQQRGSADYRAAQGVMRDVLVRVVNESYEDQLAALTCPVHLVWGADDAAVPVRIAERAAELIPGPTSLTVLPGVGHLVPTTAAAALRAATEGVLR